MKTAFLSALEETVSSTSAHLASVLEIDEEHAVLPLDTGALDPEVASQLKVGAFVILLRTPHLSVHPASSADVLPQVMVCRIDGYTSSAAAPMGDAPVTLRLYLLGMFAATQQGLGVHFSRDVGQIHAVLHHHAFMPSCLRPACWTSL